MRILFTSEYVTLSMEEQCDFIFKFALDSAGTGHVIDLNPVKVRSLPLSEQQTTLIKRTIQSLTVAPLVTLALMLMGASCQAQSSGINNNFQRDEIRFEIAQQDRVARRVRIQHRQTLAIKPASFRWRYDECGFRVVWNFIR